jgi:hypothetical protein
MIIFNELVRHGKKEFAPKIVYSFEDPDAEPYFQKCGWAKPAPADSEADVVVSQGEVDIDPATVLNGTSLLVKDVVVQAEVQ